MAEKFIKYSKKFDKDPSIIPIIIIRWSQLLFSTLLLMKITQVFIIIFLIPLKGLNLIATSNIIYVEFHLIGISKTNKPL